MTRDSWKMYRGRFESCPEVAKGVKERERGGGVVQGSERWRRVPPNYREFAIVPTDPEICCPRTGPRTYLTLSHNLYSGADVPRENCGRDSGSDQKGVVRKFATDDKDQFAGAK